MLFTTALPKTEHFVACDQSLIPNYFHGIYILQVRTARVMTILNGTNQTVPGNATRFSGIAIQQQGSDILQFVLDDLEDGRCDLRKPITLPIRNIYHAILQFVFLIHYIYSKCTENVHYIMSLRLTSEQYATSHRKLEI